MKASPERIAIEFDQIATLPERNWNHNIHYHAWLLAELPASCKRVLEIGCGKGRLSLELAKQAEAVTGIDLSNEMLKIARSRSQRVNNIRFEQTDYLQKDYPPAYFDAIVSVATLHHMDLPAALKRVKSDLKPGGKFLVIDLYEEKGWIDSVYGLASTPIHHLYKWLKNGTSRSTPRENKLWNEHGSGDEYLPFEEIKSIAHQYLPGAIVKRKLLWRYSLVWEKPLEKSPV
ncbi:MAG: class I SAM-dependent methyltransferase [Saprospiraceae bacterium]|nr:class I SAM-dependent methyltransferase [Saprospiraceae bacterium]